MLQDKEMASDCLDMLKHQCTAYTKAALESSNPQVRQAFTSIRNAYEQMQWESYQMMQQKGWYLPAAPADQQDIQRVAQHYAASMQQAQQPQPALR